nr:putative reverse transcriptase domain-containing protein [Tanacetum cinerariifolium]
MCPTLVTLEYKNVDRYVWGLPERIQENVTASRLANVHKAIYMARQLVDESVRAKATRVNESNKRSALLSAESVRELVIKKRTVKLGLQQQVTTPNRIGNGLLSNHHTEIICYEKIVRILLSNGETLEFQGERPEKDPKHLSCMKTDEKKLEDIPIVCNFLKVFSDDLLGLQPMREVEFLIDLIPRAMPMARSSYQSVPFEMQELANQLKEL